jgi:hypothetical protein
MEGIQMADDTAVDACAPLARSKLEFVIAGHSHIFALGAARDYSGSVSLTPVEAGAGHGHGYFLMEKWGPGRSQSYWDALIEHSEGRAAVLVFQGNQHFSNFLFARQPLFDFVDPLDTDYAPFPGAVLVPRRLVMALPALMPAGLKWLISQLQARGCRCVIVTGTPPVRKDFVKLVDEVRKWADWRKTAEFIGVDIATCDYTPAPIMKRLWGVVQELLADVARETGAKFVPVPAEAIESQGYLSAKYCGPLVDFTHANDEYGQLMLEHIVRAISDATANAVPPRP